MKNKFFFVMTGMLFASMGAAYALEDELNNLAGTLRGLATELSAQPLPKPQPKPQSQSTTGKLWAEKETNDRLWALTNKKHVFTKPITREDVVDRTGGPWYWIGKANAKTRAEVENAIVDYLIWYGEANVARSIIPQWLFDRLEVYLQDPTPVRLQEMEDPAGFHSSRQSYGNMGH